MREVNYISMQSRVPLGPGKFHVVVLVTHDMNPYVTQTVSLGYLWFNWDYRWTETHG